MEQFFDGYTADALVGLFFTMLFGLFPSLDVFQWLKHKLLIVDRQAHTMVIVASIAITALSMWGAGTLGFEGFEFTFGNLLAFSGTLYAASQVAYQRFKNG